MSELDTQVKSKLDLTINKEDVFTVLIAEREEEYKKELVEKQEKQKLYQERADEAFNDMLVAIAKQGNVKVDELNRTITQSGYGKKDTYSISRYNIDRLEGVKRPDLARNKKHNMQYNKLKLCLSTTATKHIKTKDGFEGNLSKQVKIEHTEYLKKLCAEYNRCMKYVHKFEAEESEVRYKIITLEFDKSIKSAFLKKVVNTTDYSTLLLGK